MEIFSLIGNQIITMYLLAIIGFFMYRFKFLEDKFIRKMTFSLVWVINPLLILSSYQMEFEMEKFNNLMLTFAFSLVTMVFIFVFSHFIFKDHTKMENMALGFGNAGFIGIPIVRGLLGIESVFYLSAYITCFNIFSYTYGIYLITGDTKNISLSRIIKNPGILTVVLGVVMYIGQIRLPAIATESLRTIGNFNTPIAMMILGTYIAKLSIPDIFTDKRAYYISFLKLMILPMLTAVLLKFAPYGTYNTKMVVLICTATPVGLTVPMFSQIYGGDYIYGAKIVSLSTLLSLVNLPITLYLGSKIMF